MQPTKGGPQIPVGAGNGVTSSATLMDGDWTVLQSLWHARFTNTGMYHLLRLRPRAERAGRVSPADARRTSSTTT
jgi:hypothetical protein